VNQGALRAGKRLGVKDQKSGSPFFTQNLLPAPPKVFGR
jgi:hypothetical protein